MTTPAKEMKFTLTLRDFAYKFGLDV